MVGKKVSNEESFKKRHYGIGEFTIPKQRKKYFS